MQHTTTLQQVDICKNGHDVSDKKKSLYFRVDNRTNKVTTACKACQRGCVDNLRAKRAKPRKLPISLLEKDFCKKGHDIRDKDASLYIYVTSAKTKNPNTTYLKCRECHRASSRAYALANGLVKQPRTNKVDWSAVRAKNDADNKARLAQKPPRSVKVADLGVVLRNEIYATLMKYDDTKLMELLLELRRRA